MSAGELAVSLGSVVAVLYVVSVVFVSALALRWLVRRWRVQSDDVLRRHAAAEAIRQEMHLDRWSTGEMRPSETEPLEAGDAAARRAKRSRLRGLPGRRSLPPPRWS